MLMKKRISPLLIFAGIVNLALFLIKFYIGIRTNSQCIYTDSINNLMDTLSLCLALIGVSFINKPSTEKFKFGFGRVEEFTAFIMSLLMTVAGLGFAYTSLGRLMSPIPVWFFTKYAVIIGCTCVVKLILGIIFASKYKKQPSAVLKTVMLDSFLDCGITAVSLASFTLSNVLGNGFDALSGLIISIIIAVSGIRLIISSASKLLGENNNALENEVIETIEKICENTDVKIKNIHLHSYGEEKLFATIYMTCDCYDEKLISIQNTIKTRLNEGFNIISAVDWEVIS